MTLTLSVLSETFTVCRFNPNDPIPTWAYMGNFYSITKTSEELSIICEEKFVPQNIKSEKSWKALKVEGPLDFALIGIMANLSGILGRGGISVFVVSTFDTDYILVKKEKLEIAKELLIAEGHTIL
jgi:hypothetical protein